MSSIDQLPPAPRQRLGWRWWAFLGMLAAAGALVFAGVIAWLGVQNLNGSSSPYTGAQLVSVLDDVGAPSGFQPVLGGPSGSDGSDALGDEQASTASVGYDSPVQAAALDTAALDTWVTQRLGALGLTITSSAPGAISAGCGDLEVDVTVDGSGSFPLSVTATGSAGPPTKPACPAALSNPPARATPVPTIAPSASGGSSTVFDWGGSSSGALGDQSTSDAARNPVRVSLPGGTTVSALAAGDDFAMALTTTGSVLAWGDDEWGELGDGATTDSEFPVLVDLPEGTVATAIAAGNGFALALTSTGAIYSWGINFFGNLGDGTSAQSDLPVPVSQLDSGMRATAIAAGGYHALALIAGQPNCVFAWGDDRLGEGGAPDPTPNDGTSGYVCVPQGTDLTTVAAGGDFSLAVSSTGSVYSWGDNRDGELGDAVGDGSTTAVLVDLPTGTQVTAVAAGLNHALALTSAGTLFAWGDNVSGDLGDGTTTKRDVPVAVRLPAGARVADIAAYDWSSLAVTSGGSILSWGMAEDTGTVDVPAPVATPGGTRVSRVAVGSDFSIATA